MPDRQPRGVDNDRRPLHPLRLQEFQHAGVHRELVLLAGDHPAVGKSSPVAVGVGRRGFDVAVPVVPTRLFAGDSRRHRHHSLAAEPPGDLVVKPGRRGTRPFAEPAQAGARLAAALGGREREKSRFDRVLHPLVAHFVDLVSNELEPCSCRERPHGTHRISRDGLRDDQKLVDRLECRGYDVTAPRGTARAAACSALTSSRSQR